MRLFQFALIATHGCVTQVSLYRIVYDDDIYNLLVRMILMVVSAYFATKHTVEILNEL